MAPTTTFALETRRSPDSAAASAALPGHQVPSRHAARRGRPSQILPGTPAARQAGVVMPLRPDRREIPADGPGHGAGEPECARPERSVEARAGRAE